MGSFAQAVASAPQTLSKLDERLSTSAPGILLARAPGDVGEALIAHAARRTKSAGRLAIVARAHAGAPLWQEVAARLSLPRLSCDPTKCAEQIAIAALLRRATIIAPLPRASSWDRAVAEELSSLASPPLVLFVGDGEDVSSDLRSERFEIAPALDDDEKRRWWSAIAEEANLTLASDQLAQLETWWAGAKRMAVTVGRPKEDAPETARPLFEALALAGRPWQLEELDALAAAASEAVAALVAVGAVQIAGGWIGIAPSWEARASLVVERASTEARERIAAALIPGPSDPEPWAYARASELLAHAAADEDGLEAADLVQTRALALADDPTLRREIAARWMKAVEVLSPGPRRELLVRIAERALAAGEPDEASRCLNLAAGLGPEDARVLMLLGRAAAALGDLVGARVALDRAQMLADAGAGTLPDAIELGALVAVEQAEVIYMTGDVQGARKRAETGIAQTRIGATVLKGRNVLGKLLLAESKWAEADRHFAEDCLLAASQGDGTAELRAQLNRGIALLSKGLPDEARSLFQAVLAGGERRGEPRACAYALSNLGHLALQRHDYAGSLEYWERAIKLLHAMRDRIAAARILGNLAALRHLLGLLDHAEHALSFGRRILGDGITAGRAAHFDVVAARIALTRGNTLDARREIDGAIVKAAGERDLLGEAHRVAARIALEDGDLPRVMQMLGRARELATKDLSRAENALLQALYERAAGNEDLEPAKTALSLVRASGEEQLLREAHVLLAELNRAAGNVAEARSHLGQALLLRDRAVERIPGELRRPYLARPDLVRLSQLEASVAAPASTPAPEEGTESRITPRAMRTAANVAREIVGDDPAIRGLLSAIRKVARSSSTILIRGESGTGKELVAEALHRASERASGPLVTVNCAALVETLLLSELFGHEKGAFTGAFARRRGRFELAEGGTLFLDEIGDISARTQVALLRVLQERTYERVGGTAALRADVRIVCATHRDLRGMVERGEFREDLYYRLRGITLEVPALRTRLGDLPRISEHLLGRIAGERDELAKTLTPAALELLARHRWPGNVRELENALRVASLFAESNAIEPGDLTDNVDDLKALATAPTGHGSGRPTLVSVSSEVDPDSESAPLPAETEEPAESDAPLPQIEANATAVAYAQVRQGCVSLSDIKRQIERDCIARALAETKGNITRAAAILGMKRPRLSQLVKQYGLAAISSEA